MPDDRLGGPLSTLVTVSVREFLLPEPSSQCPFLEIRLVLDLLKRIFYGKQAPDSLKLLSRIPHTPAMSGHK